jgi:hypothetical protein
MQIGRRRPLGSDREAKRVSTEYNLFIRVGIKRNESSENPLSMKCEVPVVRSAEESGNMCQSIHACGATLCTKRNNSFHI